MKKRIQKKKINRMMKKVLNKVGMNVKIVHDKYEKHGMYYDSRNKLIGYNAQLQKKYYEKHFKEFGNSFEENVIITMLHEIGHSMDEELEEKNREMARLQNIIFQTMIGNVDVADKSGDELSVQERYDATLELKLKKEALIVETERAAWENAEELNEKFELVQKEKIKKEKEFALSTYEEDLVETMEEKMKKAGNF